MMTGLLSEDGGAETKAENMMMMSHQKMLGRRKGEWEEGGEGEGASGPGAKLRIELAVHDGTEEGRGGGLR